MVRAFGHKLKIGAAYQAPILTPEEAHELAALGYQNPAFFCRVFLSHWFTKPMPWVHRGTLAILTGKVSWLMEFGAEVWPEGESEWTKEGLNKIIRHFVYRVDPEDEQSPVLPIFSLVEGKLYMKPSKRVLIIMPRGFSKTTITNAANLLDIVYGDTDFIVYTSESGDHAEQQLTNVKRELEGNELLIAVFGNIVPERSAKEKWQGHFIETTTGITVVSKGRGAQIRGLNVEGRRPKKIVFDDVENKESVQTEEQRKKTLNWLSGDVEPALPQIKVKGQHQGIMIGLGTILHSEAMLMQLKKSPKWASIIFGAVDPDGDMLWEEYLSRDEYEAKKLDARKLGQAALFAMEYDSTIKVDEEDKKFKSDIIRYELMERKEFTKVALAVDPAISESKKADFCSFAVVGMTDRGRFHVLDMHMEKGMAPRQQVDKFFELKFKWDCDRCGVESVAYQRALVHLLQEEMFRKGKDFGSKAYFEVEKILHGTIGKTERVEGVLQPRFAAGYITFQRRFAVLEQQLDDWPNGKKDGPDAVAMAITLLDPYAALAFDLDAEGNDKLAMDTYKSLDEELGRWRQAP